mgnify:CR=1 FL=1
MISWRICRLWGVWLAGFGVGALWAQEPTFMEAATHPGAGQFYGRGGLAWVESESASTGRTDQAASLKLAYGLTPTLAALADAEYRWRDEREERGNALSLTTFRLKYRFWRKDLGPLNTWRMSVLGGVGFPGTDDDRLAPEHPFPRLGWVSTAILGRHGINAQVDWAGYRGAPDAFDLNASHLYRLAPAEYAVSIRGAWYTQIETLNRVDDGGEAESDLAVGILYEAWAWAGEISLRLPVSPPGDRDDEREIRVGVRWLF